MVQRGPTRREVLRRAGEVGAAGVAASTAGCLGSLPFVGGPDYQKWLHEPGETGGSRDNYGFFYRNQRAVREKEDVLDDDYAGTFDNGERALGVGADDIEMRLTYLWYQVIEGEFSGDDVAGELEDRAFEEKDDHEGYTMYLNEDPETGFTGYMYAVTDNTAIRLLSYPGVLDTAIDWLEVPIDTHNGEADRYVDENDTMNTLVGKLGSKHIVNGRTFEGLDESHPASAYFEGMVGRGYGVQIQGKRTRLKQVFVFEDGDVAGDADIDDWAEGHENGDIFPNDGNTPWWEADDIDINVSGETAVAKATVDSEELGIDSEDITRD